MKEKKGSDGKAESNNSSKPPPGKANSRIPDPDFSIPDPQH